MSRDHGTRACYVFGPDSGGDRSRGCRCEACSAANRTSAGERERQIVYGRWQPYVDAGPAREHLLALSAQGIGWRRAAALSGVSGSAVSRLLRGGPGDRPPTRRVRPETEAAILAVQPTLDALADSAPVDATGTRRRIQALVARGWSQARIAARIGMLPGNFGAVVYHRPMVTAATARAVAALYEELQDQAPPEGTHGEKIAASRARRYAAERGWPPPAAWDRIDDPSAGPADGWRRGAERPANEELAADGWHLERFGLSRAEIAERLGVTQMLLSRAMNAHPEAGEAA